MSDEKTKILSLIPENLHPQLFIEVLDAMAEKKKEDSAFEAFPKPASGGGTIPKVASKEEIDAIMELI